MPTTPRELSALGPYKTPYDLFMPVTDALARRRLWAQVAIVLVLAVLPDVLSAATAFFYSPPHEGASYRLPVGYSLWLVQRSVRVVVPLVCVMYLVGQPLSSIGLWRVRATDLVGAVLLTGVSFGLYFVLAGPLEAVFGSIETGAPGVRAPMETPSWPIYLVAEIFNASSEELAIWGFLYVRLRQLWHRHEAPAIVGAALAFASYHLYTGVDGCILIFVDGVARGIFFRLIPRLWPMVLSHAGHNLLVTVIWGGG